jgi:acetyl-CoA C-acetyltransferase/acetyl-CoA acyltransferase
MTAAAVWILGGARTPFARAGTALRRLGAVELAALAMDGALARHELDPARLDEVVLGNCAQPADAANVARVAALRAGIPERVPAVTVHRNCGSGMEAVAVAAERIRSGRCRLALAGGAESMSRAPLLFPDAYASWQEGLSRARGLRRAGAALRFRPALLRPRYSLLESLRDPVSGLTMGETAERLAREFGLTRARQDEYALASHQRAVAAAGWLREEIVPAFPPPACEPLSADAGPRPDQAPEQLARLRPRFDRRHGTVTAGNSCPVSDGAVALLVGDEAAARDWPVPPLGRVRSWAVVGLDPARMGLGPVHAAARALELAGLALEDIELFEINEAFAAQVLACLAAAGSAAFARAELGRDRPLGVIPLERLNVNGGAIALGHPVGATGARLLLTLLLEMRRRGARRGLAALCVGGGQGMAFVLERDG